MSEYRPRRAAKRWLEGAPEYVLACYDNRGRTADRYTVLFGGSLWSPDMRDWRGGRVVSCLLMSDNPTHPQGVSMWVTTSASVRPGSHTQVRWMDLPDHIREHVIERATQEV